MSPTLPPPPAWVGGAGLQDPELPALPAGVSGERASAGTTSTTATCARSSPPTCSPSVPFWIACDADNTWRRTELIGYANTDQSETSESGTKRIFRKVYTVSVLAEVPQTRFLDASFYKVFRLHLDAYDREGLEKLFEIDHEGHEVLTPQP